MQVGHPWLRYGLWVYVTVLAWVQGEFMHNMLQNQKSIVNAMAINEDGVMVTGADNGSMWYASNYVAPVAV